MLRWCLCLPQPTGFAGPPSPQGGGNPDCTVDGSPPLLSRVGGPAEPVEEERQAWAESWIPAFAGMTAGEDGGLGAFHKSGHPADVG
jgi:hypothetical protein